MKAIFFLATLLIPTCSLFAQDTDKSNDLKISGYAEIYYQYDANNPLTNTRPSFIYSHNRNNELALNLAFVKASYQKENIRASLALATGSYMNANYAAENGVMKNVFEANLGVKLSGKHNIWLDAGIFPSHIGFESAIGNDCWTLTRSMLADNSPYFETGVKIGYTTQNEKWYMSALLLNGWQRIQRVNGNTTPAFGTQITYKPNGNITLNSSSFIGNDKPDSLRLMRYFHNFFGTVQFNKTWAATIGFDIGAEQKSKGSSATNAWYSPVVLIRYSSGKKVRMGVRAEYYHDKNGVIIATGTGNGFQTWGFSANMDYAISDNMTWRIEARKLSSKDKIFEKTDGSFQTGSTNVTTALSINL